MDEQIIIDCDIPGVKPARQRRSRELMVSLVNEGLALSETLRFRQLSIETICERCDTTTGSFYARFESKEVFVTALQRLIVRIHASRWWQTINPIACPRNSLPHLLAWISKGAVTWYRRNEGLVRACLRRAGSDPDIWELRAELGELQANLALPQILNLLPGRTSQARGSNTCCSPFQILHGTLNNMVLINPGPFTDPSSEYRHECSRPRCSTWLSGGRNLAIYGLFQFQPGPITFEGIGQVGRLLAHRSRPWRRRKLLQNQRVDPPSPAAIFRRLRDLRPPGRLADAPVAELVDAPDSKSGSARSAGSIPARGTNSKITTYPGAVRAYRSIKCIAS